MSLPVGLSPHTDAGLIMLAPCHPLRSIVRTLVRRVDGFERQIEAEGTVPVRLQKHDAMAGNQFSRVTLFGRQRGVVPPVGKSGLVDM